MRASPARDWHGGSGPGPDSLTSGRTPPQPRRQNNAAARPRPDASGDGYLGTRELSPYRMHCRSSIPRIPSLTPHPGVSEPSPLSDLLNQSDQETRDESDKTLMIGISTGQGSAWIANQLEEAGQIPLKRALVIARTEVNRAYREANLETMRESRAVKGYRRMCYPDTACFACLMLDGEYYDNYEDFSDHPNGKCSAVPVTKHFDPINEPEWERGQEWFERQDEATQRRLMGAGRYDLWKKQGVDPRSMVYIKPNKVWGGSPAVFTLSELVGFNKGAGNSDVQGNNGNLQYLGKVDNYEVKINNIKQGITGHISYSDIQMAGRMTRIERNREFNEAKASIDEEIKSLQKERNNAFKNFILHPDKPDYKVKVDNYNKKIAELSQKKEILGADSLKKVLSRVRTMGIQDKSLVRNHLSNGKSSVIEYVVSAYDYYPSSWIQNSIDGGKITVRKLKNRGHYDTENKRIGIGMDRDPLKTAIHELAHRFEETVNGLLSEEKDYYEKRTMLNQLERLCDIDPESKYRHNEMTKKDKFIDPYIGKDYQGKAYELASVGFEYAFTSPQLLTSDPEYETWILGLLTLL
ncbi:MAG: hypothetical protein IKP86_00315 [Anaerolineaceae bacterium]|nr:hypothetical protein [Anaerolineaceae bacterium]